MKARDVIFNEHKVFDGDLDRLKDDPRTVDLDQLAKMLQNIDVMEQEIIQSRKESEDLPMSKVEELIVLGNALAQDEALGIAPNQHFGTVNTTKGPQEFDKDDATSMWKPYPTLLLRQRHRLHC